MTAIAHIPSAGLRLSQRRRPTMRHRSARPDTASIKPTPAARLPELRHSPKSLSSRLSWPSTAVREPSDTAVIAAEILDRAGARWALMGALAALHYRAEPRFTTDVDILVQPQDR